MNKTTQRKHREKRRRQIAMFKSNRGVDPMERVLEIMRDNPLTDKQIESVVDEVVRTANQCSEDAKSLVPTWEDELRRYDY